MTATAELLATAAAKSAAHDGLVDALDGATRVLRINGLDHIYAGHFVLTCDVNGLVMCNGYVVNSTARDMTYDAIRAYRAR